MISSGPFPNSDCLRHYNTRFWLPIHITSYTHSSPLPVAPPEGSVNLPLLDSPEVCSASQQSQAPKNSPLDTVPTPTQLLLKAAQPKLDPNCSKKSNMEPHCHESKQLLIPGTKMLMGGFGSGEKKEESRCL